MSKGWKHWCPKGCGKKVVFGGNVWNYPNWDKKSYVCQTCNKKFTKEEIKNENIK